MITEDQAEKIKSFKNPCIACARMGNIKFDQFEEGLTHLYVGHVFGKKIEIIYSDWIEPDKIIIFDKPDNPTLSFDLIDNVTL